MEAISGLVAKANMGAEKTMASGTAQVVHAPAGEPPDNSAGGPAEDPSGKFCWRADCLFSVVPLPSLKGPFDDSCRVVGS